MGSSLGRFALPRSRTGIGCAALAGTAALGCAASLWAWSLASAEECAELPREDLSLSEMADVHRQVLAHKAHPESPMVFSAREASFLLREEFELLAWFSAEGDAIAGEARVEKAGRCWNVSFRGTVEVTDGRATVTPTELQVGDLALGWLVGGHAFDLGPDQVAVQPRASELLGHLERVEIQDARVVIRVDDPTWMR